MSVESTPKTSAKAVADALLAAAFGELTPEPFEFCGSRVENECDGWWLSGDGFFIFHGKKKHF